MPFFSSTKWTHGVLKWAWCGSSNPLKWVQEADNPTQSQSRLLLMRWGLGHHSNHLLPCLCFSPGNALLVYPVTDKEAKAVSVLLPGLKEVRMIQSCSAFQPTEIYYSASSFSAHRNQQASCSPPHNCYALPLHQPFCATLSLPFPQDGTVIHSYTVYLVVAAKWKKGRNLAKKKSSERKESLRFNPRDKWKQWREVWDTAEFCYCTNGP